MKTFRFDKLVRDNIVPDMLREGCQVNWWTLEDEEYYHELLIKIEEEIAELNQAKTAQEAADVMEASLAFVSTFGAVSSEHIELMDEFYGIISQHPSLTESAIEEARVKKWNKLGGFSARHYVETVSLPDGNPWTEYYERNYQEVGRV